MVRIAFGQAANRRRGDKDQPRRSEDTMTAFILDSVKAPGLMTHFRWLAADSLAF